MPVSRKPVVRRQRPPRVYKSRDIRPCRLCYAALAETEELEHAKCRARMRAAGLGDQEPPA